MKEKRGSKSVVFFCVMILTVCPLQIQAQDNPQPERGEPVYGANQYGQPRIGEILIINGSATMAMPFSLKNGEDGDFVNFELNPNGRSTYKNTTHIRVKTSNGNSVERRLAYRNRYEVFWNQDRWDVRRLTPR